MKDRSLQEGRTWCRRLSVFSNEKMEAEKASGGRPSFRTSHFSVKCEVLKEGLIQCRPLVVRASGRMVALTLNS